VGNSAAEIGAGIDTAVSALEEFGPFLATAAGMFNPAAGTIIADVTQAAPIVEGAFKQIATFTAQGLSNIDSLANVAAIFRSFATALSNAAVAGAAVAGTTPAPSVAACPPATGGPGSTTGSGTAAG